MLDSFPVTYGEIRGMLHAFAALSFKDGPANVQYDFDLMWQEKRGTAQQTIEAHFVPIAEPVTLVPLAQWQEHLQHVLEVWLFDSLILPTFSKPYWSRVVTDLVRKIEQLVQPLTVWRIDMQENHLKGYYQNLWEDYAFESEHGVFFLHLGLYD